MIRICRRTHGKKKNFSINNEPNMLEINNTKASKIKPLASSVNILTKKEPIIWNQLDWRYINQRVFRVQKQIYRYSAEKKDINIIHRLQRNLGEMFECKLLAVRKVTQDNQGKNTAGIDNIKSLSPKQRVILAKTICINNQARKIRRVLIPKPHSDEKRPLGIPTMEDRATQALALMVLEPQWEALFQPNSYGFRPGRSCHDAIEAIHSSINKKPKFVLDADIRKCFDSINHEYLLNKINTYPMMRRQIHKWIKSGIMYNNETLFP